MNRFKRPGLLGFFPRVFHQKVTIMENQSEWNVSGSLPMMTKEISE
ncbi:hypothetical protein [Paenarthrobacter sp.]|nr:hypothetical protein [Paenarthrobacter sp.]